MASTVPRESNLIPGASAQPPNAKDRINSAIVFFNLAHT
ncbi:hypothetical protein CPter291_2784 [Collimonas pratensis]|uniref:Uncharacterized protein n=1 Tax=Collimonas pratensis TaxID=279113 RepID=A0ABM5Z7M9_9BURK|nr:hypothetical protein CPter291_2784 [Collimonas pratensis]